MSVHRRSLNGGQVFDVRWRDAEGRNRARTFDTQAEADAWDEAMRVGGAYRRARAAWDALTPDQQTWATQEIRA